MRSSGPEHGPGRRRCLAPWSAPPWEFRTAGCRGEFSSHDGSASPFIRDATSTATNRTNDLMLEIQTRNRRGRRSEELRRERRAVGQWRNAISRRRIVRDRRGRRQHRAARLFRKTPGVPFSLGLLSGTLVARMSLKRGKLVGGTFVRRQNVHESRAITLYGARFCNFSSQICSWTEGLGASLLNGRSRCFGQAEHVRKGLQIYRVGGIGLSWQL